MIAQEKVASFVRQQRELGFHTLYADNTPATSSAAFTIPSNKASALNDWYDKNRKCTKCVLSKGRNQFVYGEGNPDAQVMFVGEAPGADEDASGRPFIGKAGKLLTKMIENGMGLKRETVYIANIIKCRPPENRPPAPVECATCIPILREQIRLVRPQFICLLGRTAACILLNFPGDTPLWKMRGKFFDCEGSQALVTYHPSALLQHPGWKPDAWKDLQTLMEAMGLPKPKTSI